MAAVGFDQRSSRKVLSAYLACNKQGLKPLPRIFSLPPLTLNPRLGKGPHRAPCGDCHPFKQGFQKIGGPFLSVPTIRMIIFGGPYWGPTIYSNYLCKFDGGKAFTCISVLAKLQKLWKGTSIPQAHGWLSKLWLIWGLYIGIMEKKMETIILLIGYILGLYG